MVDGCFYVPAHAPYGCVGMWNEECKVKEVKEAKDVKDVRRTYIAIILDKSGSMESIRESTIKGYNEQVQQIKMNSKDLETYVSLITFNGNVYEHLWNKPADELTLTDDSGYVTIGSTAMLDAVGYTINKLCETTDVADKFNAYLIIVISDGEENASAHYNVDNLRELIQSRQDAKNWTFTYIGCDKSYLNKLATHMNIGVGNVAIADLVSNAGAAYSNAAIGTAQYMCARSVSSTANFCRDNLYSSSGDMADWSGDDVKNNVTLDKSAATMPVLGTCKLVDWSKKPSK